MSAIFQRYCRIKWPLVLVELLLANLKKEGKKKEPLMHAHVQVQLRN